MIREKFERCPVCGGALSQAEYDGQFHGDHWVTFPPVHVGAAVPPDMVDVEELLEIPRFLRARGDGDTCRREPGFAPGAEGEAADRVRGHVGPFRLVVLESPYAGDLARNTSYARACLRDCVLRGESPLASHLLLTQEGVLEDADPAERRLGIAAGNAWIRRADALVVYTDLGISGGMQEGIATASACDVPVEYRRLPGFGGGP